MLNHMQDLAIVAVPELPDSVLAELLPHVQLQQPCVPHQVCKAWRSVLSMPGRQAQWLLHGMCGGDTERALFNAARAPNFKQLVNQLMEPMQAEGAADSSAKDVAAAAPANSQQHKSDMKKEEVERQAAAMLAGAACHRDTGRLGAAKTYLMQQHDVVLSLRLAKAVAHRAAAWLTRGEAGGPRGVEREKVQATAKEVVRVTKCVQQRILPETAEEHDDDAVVVAALAAAAGAGTLAGAKATVKLLADQMGFIENGEEGWESWPLDVLAAEVAAACGSEVTLVELRDYWSNRMAWTPGHKYDQSLLVAAAAGDISCMKKLLFWEQGEVNYCKELVRAALLVALQHGSDGVLPMLMGQLCLTGLPELLQQYPWNMEDYESDDDDEEEEGRAQQGSFMPEGASQRLQQVEGVVPLQKFDGRHIMASTWVGGVPPSHVMERATADGPVVFHAWKRGRWGFSKQQRLCRIQSKQELFDLVVAAATRTRDGGALVQLAGMGVMSEGQRAAGAAALQAAAAQLAGAQ